MLFNILKVGFSRGIAATGSLFAAFAFSHIYDVSIYGIFSIIIALLGLLVTISKFGFDLYLIKKISIFFSARDMTSINRDIKLSLFISTCICLLLSTVLLLSLDRVLNKFESLSIFLILLPLLVWQSIVSAVFKAIGKQALAAIYELGYILLIMSFIILACGYVGYVLTYLQLTLIMLLYSSSTLIFFIVYIKKIDIGFKFFNKTELFHLENKRQLFDYFILSLLAYLPTNGFPFLLSGILSDEDIGAITICFRIALLVNFFISIVNSIAMPDFSVSYKNGLEALRLKFQKYNLLLWLLCFPILLSLLLFNMEILALFGLNGKSIWLLNILLISQFFNVLTGNVTALLNMTDLQGVNRNITVFSSVFIIFLIYFFSNLGATYVGTCIGLYWVIKNLLSAYFAWSILNINVFRVSL